MIFEDLPTTPRAEELIDKAFSRAARSGRAKSGLEAQQSMLTTAGNILSDNLENVVTAWPDFEYEVDPFYRELADAIVGVDELRQSLSRITWASRQVGSIRNEYQSKLRKTDVDTARKQRKQAFARMADVVRQIEDDLELVGEARDALKNLPDVRADEPAIVVAGYPNVGKSSFVNDVTRASNEIARYPFTTKGVQLGHFTRGHIRYQIIDTPGLLDRPEEERNEIEQQAVSALEHLADVVVFLVDASGSCGYPLESQLALRDELEERFSRRGIELITVCNKSDRSTDVDADAYMSVETGENVERVLEMAADAVEFEGELPPSRQE
ncbi:GTP-binding protein, GTP1/Obg family [Halalkaliarchaeum sp. AArc-CO]|uniref:NOG1 family protein n=1 Tax=unclassified Halalkaliarchaeum TaxID=2678344 RepID=UPI00217E68AE|nr:MULTISPECIES: NOG1 family protein [unclassified Halalkaliarchaeum]MDR5673019.1 NOG1 family protein [Halalkaliarchaeum sp. AArc-GB]UWG49498.1 GTP-binding protein, GTP1/Obg family [Halalkaliarchaeum sp. AArc-CO]